MSWKTAFAAILLTLPFILIAGPSSLAADLYRWTGPDGEVHYGDRPPVNQPFRKLHQLGPPMIGEPVPQSSRRSSTTRAPASTAGRSSPARRTTRPAKSRDAGQRECDRLRSRIAAVEATMRKGYREPRGNKLRQQRRRLSEQFYSECYR